MADLVSVDWPSIRQSAISKLGEMPPHADVENDLIELFEKHPKIVIATLEAVAKKIANGFNPRSAWRFWKHQVTEALTARSTVSVTIDDDRETAVERARRWMLTEGGFLESPEAMESQLFGIPERLGSAEELEETRDRLADQYPHVFEVMVRPLMEAAILRAREADAPQLTPASDVEPLLAPWASDKQLRGEMAELWLKLRPVCERVEREVEERAAERRAQRDRMRAIAEQRVRDLDEVQERAKEPVTA